MAFDGFRRCLRSAERRLLERQLTGDHGLCGVGEHHLAERFVLADPLQAYAHGHFALLFAADACAEASHPIALRCFEKLRALARDGWFLEGRIATTDARLDGAERYARGDFAGAAAAWRTLVGAGNALPDYVSVGLEKAGEPELASENDKRLLAHRSAFNGATMAHVREAHRAAKRRDLPTRLACWPRR